MAEKCQAQISSIGEDESLAQRYSVVLEELRLEAVKTTQRPTETHHGNFDITSTLQQSSAQPEESDGLSGQPQAGFADMFPNDQLSGVGQNDATPASFMADLTSWGEFDSLVRNSDSSSTLKCTKLYRTGDCWRRWS